MNANVVIWAVCALTAAGVVLRPFGWPEAVWAVAGAVALVAGGLLPTNAALKGVGEGLDVYLFLVGMMLIAEVARREGLFDWLASVAVSLARGSATRLFALVYAVGVVVTVFLSNDATAVVLTPAVAAAARAAGVSPLPCLFVCAFVANAASFVLPISNPANLVVFGAGMPGLGPWLARFALPSVASIAATFAALWLTQRRELAREKPGANVEPAPPLPAGARRVAWGIAATTVALLGASALDMPLGAPTFVCGAATTVVALALSRESPWPVLRGVSWSVLPLVAGLFALVEALRQTGIVATLSQTMSANAASAPVSTSWAAGALVALACNLVNNLPAGLIAGSLAGGGALPPHATDALLIGVDLGPNLSVTGSLATILWLLAIRRDGVDVSAWRFLKVGAIVTPPALALALAASLAIG